MQIEEKVIYIRQMLLKMGIRAAVCIRHRQEIVLLMTPMTFQRHQQQVERWFTLIELNQQYCVLGEREDSIVETA
jgi:hypothetical protein